MARDFRPRSARASNGENIRQKTRKKLAASKKVGIKDSQSSTDDEEDGELLENIKAMGGDEADLDLIRKDKKKGKSRELQEDLATEDPALNSEVLSFMKGLDFKAAGLPAPKLMDSRLTNKGGHQLLKPALVRSGKKGSGSDKERVGAESNGKTKVERGKNKAVAQAETSKSDKKDAKKFLTSDSSTKKLSEHHSSTLNLATLYAKNKGGFLNEPSAQWSEIELPPLQSASASNPTADEIASLQDRGMSLLKREKELYTTLNRSGKGLGPGMLSSSDAKFIAELLGPGAKGGTLSDRVAALTMLTQSSPIHNLDAMESLLQMAGKKGREESGRATRALADWLASKVGLSDRKLRYLRDHPSTSQLVQLLLRTKDLDHKQQNLADAHLLLATFEDKLKRSYFSFIQMLETQTHDTLPFVRKQAVTQLYLLLKEKSEQEQNLLRLLVNKLGDIDRAVASKASSSLLNILTAHPNMKVVISREISNLIMKPTGGLDDAGKPKFNSHARYYGMLTLNQIMFTFKDEPIANSLVNLYFELFETVLNEMSTRDEDKEEKVENEENAEKAQVAPKKVKQRWRDGKAKKGKVPIQDESKVIQDADAKIMAAVLTGVRRALPFANIDAAMLDKHMSTLFRITHASTFNISIQALQLIYQVTLTNTSASSLSNTAVNSVNVEDRFYRALYASMLDPRLATTSKQAMYLNLLFKAIKSDGDSRRVKAFVKRFVQTFDHSEPPWICGGLYLLGELVVASPGLKTLMDEPEDEGDEHYVDAVEASDGEGVQSNSEIKKASATEQNRLYDALKREPQYAKAENSCLWEIVPLLFHFHPSVSLHARQLLSGEEITTTVDLTLNTLSHFLDRFVYRNPKKTIAASKGVSIMQPALNVNDGKVGVESGVVKLKGIGIRKDEFVNDEGFWNRKVQDVPVDQLFFHKYFLQKLKRNGAADRPEDEAESEGSDGSLEEGDDDEDSLDEKEIWKAIKKTMPRMAGDDELLNESDVDEDDDDMMKLLAEEEGSEDEEDSNTSEGSDELPFDEDEDDLVSIDFEAEEGSEVAAKSGRKRELEDDEGDAEQIDTESKSKSQLRREEKRRRKALSTFASAEEYAHLLGASGDEEGEDESE